MLATIIVLLVIGLALIVIEVVFVPGTTFVGIMGAIFIGAGIIVSYRTYGAEVGLYVLVAMALVTAVVLFFSFRSEAWTRFANKSAIDSKVNEGSKASLKVGDEGITRSALRPMGTAEFQGKQFEVRTLGDYLNPGTRVQIIHLDGGQVIVKPLN